MVYFVAYGLYMDPNTTAKAIGGSAGIGNQAVTVIGFQRHFGALPLQGDLRPGIKPPPEKKNETICTLTPSPGCPFNGVIYRLGGEEFELLITRQASIGFSPIEIPQGHILSFPQNEPISLEEKALAFAGSPENCLSYLQIDGGYIDSVLNIANRFGKTFFQTFIETTFLPDRKETLKQRYGGLVQDG